MNFFVLSFFFTNLSLIILVFLQQKIKQTINFTEQISKNNLNFSNLEKLTFLLILINFILLISKFWIEF